jgi:NAD(P)-dependent dehydrogenase (short-subunit alcohol dehydrogenase family)
MSQRIKDKVAIISGGGTGIGAATARLFASEGATVAICGRSIEPLQAVAQEIKDAGGRADFQSVDVSDDVQFTAFVESTREKHGRLDIIVNNAFGMVVGMLEDMSTEDWHAAFSTTLDATFYGIRAAMPIMAKQGRGSIINIGSSASHGGQPALGAYGAAKAAIENLTRTAAIEGAVRNVRVNTVTPGFIATEPVKAAYTEPATLRAIESIIPLGRMGEPEEVANAILFLGSDESSFITGACLVVDGGNLASLGIPQLDQSPGTD